VVEKHIYAAMPADCRVLPVAETALTLAAQELALAGLGTAWLPRSLVQGMLADRRLTDLSGHLPSVALDVTAVRLATQRQPIEDAIWAVLTG
jgi:LysR family transcriptional regulator, hypochlorite-specific transcription factor HypT